MKYDSDFFLSFPSCPYWCWLYETGVQPEAVSAAQVNDKEERFQLKLIGTLSLNECSSVIKHMSSLTFTVQEHSHGFYHTCRHTRAHTHVWLFENKYGRAAQLHLNS